MKAEKEILNAKIFYLISFVGGYLGLIPILSIAKSFASALTTNWIYLPEVIFDGDILKFILRIGVVIAFMVPIVLITYIEKKNSKINLPLIAVIIDCIDALILFFLPESTNPIIAMYPNLFAMSFQWCSFKGVYNYPIASIFMTNNTRQLISSLTEVYINKDNSFKIKAEAYGFTLLSFVLGVIICYILWYKLNKIAALLIIPVLLVEVILINKQK